MQTEEEKKEIELSGRELQAQELMVDLVMKTFKALEDHYVNYCKDHKKSEVPLVYLIASMDNMAKGYRESLAKKKEAIEKRINDILDGKDGGERFPLQGEALYPGMEAITKEEQEGIVLSIPTGQDIPIGVDPEEKGATND